MTSKEELAAFEKEARRRAVEAGVWLAGTVAEQEVMVTHLSVATTNTVFCCSAPGHAARVAVRFFGRGSGAVVDRAREQALMARLGPEGLSPVLCARFPGGVVQTFVEGVTLDACTQLAPYHRAYAATLARLHTTDCRAALPRPAHGPCIWPLLDRWLGELAACLGPAQDCAQPFVTEARALRAHIARVAEPQPMSSDDNLVPALCLCHNDTSAFNVVFSHRLDGSDGSPDDGTCRATLIDLEYADYNDPHFDLGNHVCEHCGLETDLVLWPSAAAQRDFVRHYLCALCACRGRDAAAVVTDALVEQERVRTLHWCLVSHLLWAVWGVLQFVHAGRVPVCGFDHLDYAHRRLRAYVLQRAERGVVSDVPDSALLDWSLPPVADAQ